jgi:hypothetical protein
VGNKEWPSILKLLCFANTKRWYCCCLIWKSNLQCIVLLLLEWNQQVLFCVNSNQLVHNFLHSQRVSWREKSNNNWTKIKKRQHKTMKTVPSSSVISSWELTAKEYNQFPLDYVNKRTKFIFIEVLGSTIITTIQFSLTYTKFKKMLMNHNNWSKEKY